MVVCVCMCFSSGSTFRKASAEVPKLIYSLEVQKIKSSFWCIMNSFGSAKYNELFLKCQTLWALLVIPKIMRSFWSAINIQLFFEAPKIFSSFGSSKITSSFMKCQNFLFFLKCQKSWALLGVQKNLKLSKCQKSWVLVEVPENL